MFASARALHQVLKIGSLKDNIHFFRDKLKMTVLRHEVFGEGCKATCNGPYDGKWTKTMIGYGPESGDSSHFVLELTYNNDVPKYEMGNDLQYIKIAVNKELYDTILAATNVKETKPNLSELTSPDGYKFLLRPLLETETRQDIVEVCLSVNKLNESLKYWRDFLKLKPVKNCADLDDENKKLACLSYDETKQVRICLKEIGEKVDRAEAYGRTAFSIPKSELKPLEKLVNDKGYRVHTPYISLDTPGKPTVEVVILQDPNGHEICFVCEEGFSQLSKPDEKIENLYY